MARAGDLYLLRFLHVKPLCRTLLVLLLLVGASRTARAEDRVGHLIRILESPEATYKVKLLTMAYLGRFRARRAVPALLRLLDKTHSHAVRRLAITTLGNIGAAEAVPALAAISRHNRYRLGASARRAMRAIARQRQRTKRVVVALGRFSNRTRRGGQQLAGLLRSSLAQALRQEPTVALDTGAGIKAASLDQSQIRGYMLDGSIVRMRRRVTNGRQLLTCQIRVSVASHPGGSMKAFYRGEASIDAAAWQREETLYRDVIEAAAGEASQQILQGYLFRQASASL